MFSAIFGKKRLKQEKDMNPSLKKGSPMVEGRNLQVED